jgi:hypothetical protein
VLRVNLLVTDSTVVEAEGPAESELNPWGKSSKSFRPWDGVDGVGVFGGWYGPGTWLTEWTGDIPDTATMAGLSLKRADAMENEQCDGREAAVCI